MQSKDLRIIKHIEEYCTEIHKELTELNCDRGRFDENSVYKNSLALCVLQIGELVGLLTDEYKEANKDISWKNIRGMRNVVAHKYGTFDFDVLWETVTEDIPKLHQFCKNELGKDRE